MYDDGQPYFDINKIGLYTDFAMEFTNKKGRADLARPVNSNCWQFDDAKSIRFDFF
jgi:hypothetical protein